MKETDEGRLAGYVFGALTAVCWATSPIFIRLGLEGLPSAPWGTFVGVAAATVVYGAWYALRRPGERAQPAGNVRAALGFQALAGIASGMGTIGRSMAIDLAPIVIAVPLSQTTTLFTVILAPLLLGRELENVTLKLAVGAVCVVLGSVLIIVGRNA